MKLENLNKEEHQREGTFHLQALHSSLQLHMNLCILALLLIDTGAPHYQPKPVQISEVHQIIVKRKERPQLTIMPGDEETNTTVIENHSRMQIQGNPAYSSSGPSYRKQQIHIPILAIQNFSLSFLSSFYIFFFWGDPCWIKRMFAINMFNNCYLFEEK